LKLVERISRNIRTKKKKLGNNKFLGLEIPQNRKDKKITPLSKKVLLNVKGVNEKGKIKKGIKLKPNM